MSRNLSNIVPHSKITHQAFIHLQNSQIFTRNKILLLLLANLDDQGHVDLNIMNKIIQVSITANQFTKTHILRKGTNKLVSKIQTKIWISIISRIIKVIETKLTTFPLHLLTAVVVELIVVVMPITLSGKLTWYLVIKIDTKLLVFLEMELLEEHWNASIRRHNRLLQLKS